MRFKFLARAALIVALIRVGTLPSPAQAENIDDVLNRAIGRLGGEAVYIAPMTKKGDPSQNGGYSDAEGGIFTAILKRISLKPGETEPKDTQTAEGFLEFIDQSVVLNECGTRSTFGYFIQPGQGKRFFVLFSYDHIRVMLNKECKGDSNFAFETFLFGPIENDDDAGPLRRGLAVATDGQLLGEVPIDLAKVSNVLGKKDHENETVKPGVDQRGNGCLACHARRKGLAQATLPFPWVRKIDPCLVGTWQAEALIPLTSMKKAVGGGGFRVTFADDGEQITDYSDMKPQEWDKDTPSYSGHTYRGIAKGYVTTAYKQATLEDVQNTSVTVQIWQSEGFKEDGNFQPMNGLGPGGLGTTIDDNSYVCEGDTLEYKTSTAADKHPNHSVKLNRVKK
jgi:hypothetical protein